MTQKWINDAFPLTMDFFFFFFLKPLTFHFILLFGGTELDMKSGTLIYVLRFLSFPHILSLRY